MLQDIRSSAFAAKFSEGIEFERQLSASERRERRARILHEGPARILSRACLDLSHALSVRALKGLPGTIDFVLREQSLGASQLPDARQALKTPDGLAGLVADMSPTSILDGYGRGLYLRWLLGWPAWWAPARRMTAAIADIRETPHALALMIGGGLRITLDREFEAVVAAATARAIEQRLPYAPSARGMNIFATMHDAGYAHSVEVNDRSGRLIGGLYGIACGRAFTIQSVFGAVDAVCDLAVGALTRHLRVWGFEIVDGCSDRSLARLGFNQTERDAHLDQIGPLFSGGRPGRWLVERNLLKIAA